MVFLKKFVGVFATLVWVGAFLYWPAVVVSAWLIVAYGDSSVPNGAAVWSITFSVVALIATIAGMEASDRFKRIVMLPVERGWI